MRGKDRSGTANARSERITPAYAGKSYRTHSVRQCLTDHPRLCGEKRSGGSTSSLVRGSPPPMRGKGEAFKGDYATSRITPAYAGKRLFIKLLEINSQDHPRLCGEKRNPRISYNHGKGSPPPMRGKASVPKMLQLSSGITPAYAGKSSRFCFPMNPSWDHPRLCGEKGFWNRCKCSREGSPPPMRGKVWLSVSFGFTTRITPAYAGKSPHV